MPKYGCAAENVLDVSMEYSLKQVTDLTQLVQSVAHFEKN